MKWGGNRQSSNVEDRRGSGGFGGRGIGIGTLLVVLIGGMLFGIDPLTMLSMMSGDDASRSKERAPTPAGRRACCFRFHRFSRHGRRMGCHHAKGGR